MFLGHFALAFAAKKLLPRVSLGTTVFAAQLVDVLWPLMLVAGIEQVRIVPGITAVTPLDFVSYPYTHSLVAVLVWAALFGAVHLAFRRNRGTALWLGALVASHWVLDALSHRPDLPLYPGSVLVGAGLWFSLPASLTVELGLFAIGIWIYTLRTRPDDRTGTLALWGFCALLVALYLGSVFGPPPPSATLLAVGAIVGWLFIPWAYWIDRHRIPSERR